MRTYINFTEKALKNQHWKAAVLNGIQLGIASHIALKARPLLEFDLLSGRKQRSGFDGQVATKKEDTQANYRQYVTEFDRSKVASLNKDRHPIVTTIANEYGVSERTIYRTLKDQKQ